MTTAPTNLFMRNDTFFGVCEAIGQDFGFNANWLRVAFAVPLLVNPAITFGAYALLGLIVALSRFFAPRPAAPAMAETPAAALPAPANSDVRVPALAEAA